MFRFAVPLFLVTLLAGASAYESIRGANAAAAAAAAAAAGSHATMPAAAVEAESIKQQQEAAAVAVAQEQAIAAEEESALRELRGRGIVRGLLNKPRKMRDPLFPIPVPTPVVPPFTLSGNLPSFMPVIPSMYKPSSVSAAKVMSSRLVYPQMALRSVYPSAYNLGSTYVYPSAYTYPSMVKTVKTVTPAAYYPSYRTTRTGLKVIPSAYYNDQAAAVAQIRASQAAAAGMAKPEFFGLGASFAKSFTDGFVRPDVVVVPTQNSTQILAQETTNRNRLVPTLVNSPTDTLTDTQGYTPVESTQLFNVPNVDLSSGSLAAGLGGAGGAGGAGGSSVQGQGQGQQQGQGAIVAGIDETGAIIPEMQVMGDEEAAAMAAASGMVTPEAVMQAGQAGMMGSPNPYAATADPYGMY